MKSVAIACQGGGSHTAFTAGVLRGLLTSQEFARRYQIAALSGTSGGAICAAIVWARLPAAHGQATRRGAESAAEALREFWLDLSCDNGVFFAPCRGGPFDYMDALSNAIMISEMRLNPFAEQQCKLASRITRRRMLELLERHISVGLLEGRALDRPKLRIGATDILEGYSEPITVEDYRHDEVHRILLASASIPPLFPPAALDGAYFWDGLYSHNPPIDCLTNLEPPPDEIWVIQINPDSRSTPPQTAAELVDRRNELTGNLSLAAELYHIDAMNWLIRRARALQNHRYKVIKLRVVGLRNDLDFASKYDRSRTFIEWLMEEGERSAGEFFKTSSVWTTRTSGVHTAAVDPRRTGMRRRRHTSAQPFTFCSTACPGSALCNTTPFLGPVVEEAFEVGQRYYEAPVSLR
jgi:NTE family protein